MTDSVSVALLLLSLVLAGCQSYIPVRVQVLDGATGAAVSGARVESRVGYGMTPFPPKRSAAVTDANGRAVVRISDTRSATSRGAAVTSPGYLVGTALLPPDWFEQRRRKRHPAEAAAPNGPAELIVKLYREPHPYFLFIIPDGYRGLLRLDLSPPTTERVLAPEEREVTVTLRPPAPRKLPLCRLDEHFVDWKDFTARYADGTPIPAAPSGGGQVGLRYVVAWNMRYVYVIGTESDARAARARVRDLFRDFDSLWDDYSPGPRTEPVSAWEEAEPGPRQKRGDRNGDVSALTTDWDTTDWGHSHFP